MKVVFQFHKQSSVQIDTQTHWYSNMQEAFQPHFVSIPTVSVVFHYVASLLVSRVSNYEGSRLFALVIHNISSLLASVVIHYIGNLSASQGLIYVSILLASLVPHYISNLKNFQVLHSQLQQLYAMQVVFQISTSLYKQYFMFVVLPYVGTLPASQVGRLRTSLVLHLKQSYSCPVLYSVGSLLATQVLHYVNRPLAPSLDKCLQCLPLTKDLVNFPF